MMSNSCQAHFNKGNSGLEGMMLLSLYFHAEFTYPEYLQPTFTVANWLLDWLACKFRACWAVTLKMKNSEEVFSIIRWSRLLHAKKYWKPQDTGRLKWNTFYSCLTPICTFPKAVLLSWPKCKAIRYLKNNRRGCHFITVIVAALVIFYYYYVFILGEKIF